MKEYAPYTPWIIVSVLFLLAFGVLAGCKITPQRATFDALAGTEITVDQAMQAWGAYVGQFHPPADQEKAVSDAYAKYQATESTAIDAAQIVISLTSTNSPDLAGAQSKALQASAASAAALGDLVNLVRQFGAKL